MADAKLTALTAASALAGADLFYISQGGVSKKATHTQLLTLVGTTYVPLAGGTMTGALTLPAGSSATPALSFGGNTGFWYDSGAGFIGIRGYASTNTDIVIGNGTVRMRSSESFGWSLGLDPAVSGSDLVLQRDAAATLAQRNGTTQQIFRLYSTYTDSSNFERLTLTGVAGTSVNITAETLGTGGDNIDLVLTPAGTGSVLVPVGTTLDPGIAFSGFSGTGLWSTGSGAYVVVSCNQFAAAYFNASSTGLPAAGVLGWAATGAAGSSSNDAGIARNAAGIVEVNNGTAGTWRDLKLRNLLNTEYHQMTEMTAPSAPATNSVRIYAEDNGAGKTRLMALFATGSAVQLGIEP